MNYLELVKIKLYGVEIILQSFYRQQNLGLFGIRELKINIQMILQIANLRGVQKV